LIVGDDGLPADVVGAWAKEKHRYLCQYIDITRGARSKFIGPRTAGATFIDLFSSTGRSYVRSTREFIDGSCVAAWKASQNARSPFSTVYIADLEDGRRNIAAERLRRAGAPVVEVQGSAMQAAAWLAKNLNPYALHFAFVDPYNLGAFDFGIIRSLAALDRIDMLAHVSKMDMQRNLGMNVRAQQTAFDVFAPGWRQAVNLDRNQGAIRRDVLEYWRRLVDGAGIAPSAEMRLITGSKGQHLYWLLIAAKHDLAHRLWKVAAAGEQPSLF